MAKRTLTVEIVGDASSLKAAFHDANTHGGKFGKSMGAAGAGAKLLGGAALAGGTAAATGMLAAVTGAMSFEKQMSSLGSVTGASAEEMKLFKTQAMQAGAQTAFSANEAAEAQTELAKGGLSLKNIMGGGLSGALALAAAGEMELGDAAATTANALNLFKMSGDQATRVADMMATAANATTADVSDFAMALKAGGSVAKTVGLDFKETMVGLEALAAAGIQGSDAGTSLKTSLLQLVNPTNKQAGMAEELGLKFTDATGHMKSMSEISAMLRERLGGMTAAQRTAALATLAGSDGVRTLTSLYDSGPAKLEAFAKGLDKQGSAAEVAKKKQDNLAGAIEGFKGSIETLGIIVGTTVLPWLKKATEALTGFMNGLMAGTGAGGKFRDVITTVGSAIGTAFTFVKGVVVDSVIPALVTAFTWVKATVTDWLTKNREEIVQFTQAVINVATAIKDTWVFVIKNLLIPAFKLALEVVEAVWPSIKGIVEGAIDYISGLIKIFSGVLTGDFGKAWEGVKAIFSGAITVVLGMLKSAVNLVLLAAGKIGQAIIDGIKALASAYLSLGKWVVTTWLDGLKAMGEAIGDAAGWLKNRVVEHIKLQLAAFKAVGGWVLEKIVDGLTFAGNVFKDLGGWVWERIKNNVELSIAAFKGVGGWVLEKFVVGLTTAGEAFKDVGTWFVERIGNKLISVAKELKDLGFGIVGTMIEGIKQAPKAIADAADWLKDKIVSAVESAFDMHSPSRVMMQLGGHVVSGLIKGMTMGDVVQFIKGSLGGMVKMSAGMIKNGMMDIGDLPDAALDKLVGLFKGGSDSGLSNIAGQAGKYLAMVSKMNAIDAENFPYVYGGGHNAHFSGPFDCSGLVSAILHAGGLLNSPVSTDGLKPYGGEGAGKLVTVGVRGSSGRNAHTMMKLGSRFLESGSGHGAKWVNGWSGNFPIMRHPAGMAQGGIVRIRTGETGPEDVYLPTGSRVVPNHATRHGGDGIVINNYGPIGSQATARVMADRLAHRLAFG